MFLLWILFHSIMNIEDLFKKRKTKEYVFSVGNKMKRSHRYVLARPELEYVALKNQTQ